MQQTTIFKHYLINIPICIQISVKNAINILIAPSFYTLDIRAAITPVNRALFKTNSFPGRNLSSF